MALTVTDPAGIATITLGAGQTIRLGNATPYATSLVSTDPGDTLIMVCITASSSPTTGAWQVIGPFGNWGGT